MQRSSLRRSRHPVARPRHDPHRPTLCRTAPPAQGLGVRPPSATKTSREARQRGLLARVALGSAFILGAAMMLTFFYVAAMSFVPAVRAIRGGLPSHALGGVGYGCARRP